MDENSKINSKVSGYLDKKGKMKMMSSYKRYWFVLEGRLLLYYRSKDEYEAISPCKGSINLGPPCNVKPCYSTPGVFQIETRTNTITLRAENQEDQNRWMQGIMSALNQNKNSSKLGHFRYSMNESSHEQTDKQKLYRQSKAHSVDSPKSQASRGIIERLQKIGAHSYGGSIDAINQIANNKKGENISNSDESLQYPSDLTFRNSILMDHQYEPLKNKVSSEDILLPTEHKPKEHIYEGISRNATASSTSSKKVSYYMRYKTDREEHYEFQSPHTPTENLQTNSDQADKTNRPTTFLLENEVYKTPRDITTQENNNIHSDRAIVVEEDGERPTTFLLDNEVYANPKINTQNNNGIRGRETSLILENETYHIPDKMIFRNGDSEMIYNEPKCTEVIDHNENNVVLRKNRHLAECEENAYSVVKIYDSEKNVSRTNSTSEYEDLDIVEYSERQYQTIDDICEERSNKSKSILKKTKKTKYSKGDTDDKKKDVKLKKAPSFIRRVWRKKNKHKETEQNDDGIYETVPPMVVEKVSVNDTTAIQMLSELQNILEHKKPILSTKLSESNASKNSEDQKRDKKCTTDLTHENQSSSNDETTVQMINELQNILENRKNILTARIGNKKEETTFIAKPEKNLVENDEENKHSKDADVEGASASGRSEKMRPLLPPKTQRKNKASPYHDSPKNNQPIEKIVPPKKKRNLENIKSLDEILCDLENQKCENSNKDKVKRLIKQFSDSEFSDNDVVLRTNKRPESFDVDSDELSRLLEELAKVTCAPILTPGVTSSLINPNLTDEELLNLIPKRRRRYSEPDYDIPRPHKSLINLPKQENHADSAIGSTRFFGPILKPSDINIKTNVNSASEEIESMTPDSLEMEAPIAACPNLSYLSDEEKNSYSSHKYCKYKYISTCGMKSKESNAKKNVSSNLESTIRRFDNIIIENDIYSQPKSLHDINAVKEFKTNSTHNCFFKSNKHLEVELCAHKMQEVFEDSLEMCNNQSS